MCVIVDNDVAHEVLVCVDDREFGAMHEYLQTMAPSRSGRLVYGGHLLEEYSEEVRHAVALLDDKGAARPEDETAVKSETARLSQQRLCKSNDAHVVALGRVSGARLLCTRDRRSGLMADWHDTALLDKPPGRIYSRAGHKKMIVSFLMCRNCKVRQKTCGR